MTGPGPRAPMSVCMIGSYGRGQIVLMTGPNDCVYDWV